MGVERRDTPIPPSPLRAHRSMFVPVIASSLVMGFLILLAIGMINRSAKPVAAGVAPSFTMPLYGGGNFSLADQRGKVVVINFWASWCIPCRAEAPMLERVWKRYQERGVILVGVDYADTESEALKFLKEWGITYPNGPDLGTEISRRYRIQGVPETYFVNKEGMLDGNRIGPLDESMLIAKIEELLKK